MFCLPFQCSRRLSKCLGMLPWQLKGGIALCKGLEPASNLFAHEVIEEEMGTEMAAGYLTGPSHAYDIAVGSQQLCHWQ